MNNPYQPPGQQTAIEDRYFEWLNLSARVFVITNLVSLIFGYAGIFVLSRFPLEVMHYGFSVFYILTSVPVIILTFLLFYTRKEPLFAFSSLLFVFSIAAAIVATFAEFPAELPIEGILRFAVNQGGWGVFAYTIFVTKWTSALKTRARVWCIIAALSILASIPFYFYRADGGMMTWFVGSRILSTVFVQIPSLVASALLFWNLGKQSFAEYQGDP